MECSGWVGLERKHIVDRVGVRRDSNAAIQCKTGYFFPLSCPTKWKKKPWSGLNGVGRLSGVKVAWANITSRRACVKYCDQSTFFDRNILENVSRSVLTHHPFYVCRPLSGIRNLLTFPISQKYQSSSLDLVHHMLNPLKFIGLSRGDYETVA